MEGKEEAKATLKKGFWKPEEDLILKKYVESHGEGNWTVVSKKSGKNSLYFQTIYICGCAINW